MFNRQKGLKNTLTITIRDIHYLAFPGVTQNNWSVVQKFK